MALDKFERLDDMPERVTVAGVKSGEGIVEHARVFSAKALADQFLQLGYI